MSQFGLKTSIEFGIVLVKMAEATANRKTLVQQLRRLASECKVPGARVRDDARRDKVKGMVDTIRNSTGTEALKACGKKHVAKRAVRPPPRSAVIILY